jgi:hypothetical protein
MLNNDLNPNEKAEEKENNASNAPISDRSPAPIPTSNPQNIPRGIQKSRLFIRIWRIHRKRQQRIAPPNIAEKITVFLILVTAFIGAVQARIYYQQKKIMESSGQQTQQLIDAANIQACAAKSFAQSAANINLGIGHSVDKLNLQAEATNGLTGQFKRGADIAEEGNEPSVGIANNTPAIDFDRHSFSMLATVVNFGKSAAIDLDITITMYFNNSPVVLPKNPHIPFKLLSGQPDIIEGKIDAQYFDQLFIKGTDNKFIPNLNNSLAFKTVITYKSRNTGKHYDECYRTAFRPELSMKAFVNLGCK